MKDKLFVCCRHVIPIQLVAAIPTGLQYDEQHVFVAGCLSRSFIEKFPKRPNDRHAGSLRFERPAAATIIEITLRDYRFRASG